MERTSVSSKKKRTIGLPIGIGIALACYSVLVIPHFGYIPVWDSLENLEEYLFLPRTHVLFDNLLLMHNGHPSLGYFLPFWIGQAFFPAQMMMIHIINLLIGFLAIIAFGKVAELAFKEISEKREIALITVAFAVHPVFVAYAVNMSPDYGVLAYFLASVWCLYSGRLGWVALTGTLLIFSKEIGIPTYLVLVVFYLSGAIRKYRWIDLWPLAVPLLMFGFYCAYQKYYERPIFPWMGHYLGHESVWDTYLPNPFKGDFKMACLGPFVLEFQWLFTAVILAGLLGGILARSPTGLNFSGIKQWLEGVNLPFRCFLFLLAGCLYIDSRTVIFTNQRYFLTLYALVLLLFLAALIQLKVQERVRTGILAATILLLFACNFRTLDPISRKIAGTFSFGHHEMLSISTIRPDFGATNRDSMIYNMEHTHLSSLLDKAFEKIQPTDKTVIVMPSASWWIMSRIDAATHHRTESTQLPYIKPKVLYPESLAKNANQRAEMIFALALPYNDNQTMMNLLRPFYEIKERFLFDEDGYELEVWEMTRK